MNKTKMTLAVVGGVIGLAVLVMAYLTWSAFSAKTAALEGDDEEGTDGLETVMSRAESLSRLTANHPVYPCAASLTAIESNRTAIVDWQQEATKLATRGDRIYKKTTPPAFKTFIVSDAKRLMTLPGSVSGALAKPDFAFGPFREYIVEGKMPAESQLAELQRRWDDVATVVEVLGQCGVAELTDVQFKADEKKPEPQDKKGKNAKKRTNDKRQPTAGEAAPKAFSYVFTFTTKPAGFTKVLNALVVGERFVTVDGFTFGRARDALAETLDGDEKKKEAAASGGRRGRRRGSAALQQDKQEEEKKGVPKGIVSDPQLEEPITVVLTATVYDFRSLEEGGEAGAEEKKGASK